MFVYVKVLREILLEIRVPQTPLSVASQDRVPLGIPSQRSLRAPFAHFLGKEQMALNTLQMDIHPSAAVPSRVPVLGAQVLCGR